jgi:alpha-tubulin suppressor-like RCC1 family protein
MFTSKVWRVIACGLIGLGAVAVVLSIGQTRVRASTHAESSVTAPDGNGGATVQGISAGGNHICAQMSNGRLLCWGSNSSGHLGDGTTTPRFMPVDVVSVTSGAGSVVAGGMMSCATINGGVKCWGANNVGQLGTGNTASSNVPTDVVGLASGVTALGLGTNHSCAVVSGAARCWGYNLDGQ